MSTSLPPTATKAQSSPRVLITGSGGFVGTALREALTQHGIAFDTVTRVEAGAGGDNSYDSENHSWRVPWPTGLRTLPYSDYSVVVHLAFPPMRPGEAKEAAIEGHQAPLQAIAEGIQHHCLLLFFSSQSASPDAVSSYGQGKWACEEFLKKSAFPWVILNPGLIVGGTGRALYHRIVGALKRLPILPVPVGEPMAIQPVLIQDVVDACLAIIRTPAAHHHQQYELALPRRSLLEFLREVATLTHQPRLFIPVPWKAVAFLLQCAELLPFPLPVSRGNILGLLASKPLSPERAESALGITLHPLSAEALTPKVSVAEEAQFLFYSLFRCEPPAQFIPRYAAAQSKELLTGQWIDVRRIVYERLNVDAIELAVRRKKTILSQKLQICCYLGEANPSLFSHYINTSPQRLRGFLTLFMATMATPVKLLYGAFLVHRHQLLHRSGGEE